MNKLFTIGTIPCVMSTLDASSDAKREVVFIVSAGTDHLFLIKNRTKCKQKYLGSTSEFDVFMVLGGIETINASYAFS